MSNRVAYVVGQSSSIEDVKATAESTNTEVATAKASLYDALMKRWPEGQAIERVDQGVAAYEKSAFNDFNRWTIDVWKPLYEKAKTVVNSTADAIAADLENRRQELRGHKTRLASTSTPKPSTLLGGGFDPTPKTETVAPVPTQSEVSEAQTLLLKLGYKLGPAGVTGIYDLETYSAVVQFQGASGLNRSGILDAKTLATLRAEAAKLGPSTPGASVDKTVTTVDTKNQTVGVGSTVKGIPLGTLGLVAAGVAGVGALVFWALRPTESKDFRYSGAAVTPARY